MRERGNELSQEEIRRRLQKLEEYERREREQAEAERLTKLTQALRWIETWLFSTLDQFEIEGRDDTLTKSEWDRVIRQYGKSIETTGITLRKDVSWLSKEESED